MPGEFHEQRSLVGYSPWGCKESDMTKQLTHTQGIKEKNNTVIFSDLATAINR